MTLQEFSRKCKVTSRTAKKWLKKGLVPGAYYKEEKWVIPESARAPYTSARAKNRKAINSSIIKACVDGNMLCHNFMDYLERNLNNI